MDLPPATYPEDVLVAALAHARAAAPLEACGLVVRLRDGILRYRPMENAADRYRAADPEAWPWGPDDSFVLAPAELVEAFRAADRGDARPVAVVHSHPRGGGALSPRDRAGALDAGGRPILPVDEWLVVGLSTPRGPEVVAHRHGSAGWSSRGLPLPPAAGPGTVWRWGGKLCPCRNAGR